MKSTGIVRKIDELGRIVLPIELRRVMDLEPGDGVSISVEGNRILLQKHENSCLFCGGADDLRFFKEKCVCGKCAKELNK